MRHASLRNHNLEYPSANPRNRQGILSNDLDDRTKPRHEYLVDDRTCSVRPSGAPTEPRSQVSLSFLLLHGQTPSKHLCSTARRMRSGRRMTRRNMKGRWPTSTLCKDRGDSLWIPAWKSHPRPMTTAVEHPGSKKVAMAETQMSGG